jgi:hypothetical protein
MRADTHVHHAEVHPNVRETLMVRRESVRGRNSVREDGRVEVEVGVGVESTMRPGQWANVPTRAPSPSTCWLMAAFTASRVAPGTRDDRGAFSAKTRNS